MSAAPPFRCYLRVRYVECDAQKVVFNSRYSEYVDVGMTEFLRAAAIQHEFADGLLDFQLVKQTIELAAGKVQRESHSRNELMNGAYLRDVFAKYGVL